jgi:hypothetical protein
MSVYNSEQGMEDAQEVFGKKKRRGRERRMGK